MNKKFAIALSSMVVSASAFAIPPQETIYSPNNETRVYVGAQWVFGKTKVESPNIVLGLRNTRTNVSNDVSGIDATLTFSTMNKNWDAARVAYIGGKCDVLGTVGVGYSYAKKEYLGFAGLLSGYSKATLEIDQKKSLDGVIELNTQKCPGDRNTQTVNMPT